MTNPQRTFVIAEAGVNHNGDLALAERLVAEAASCGADAVKFQTFKAEHIATCRAEKAAYQIDTTGRESSQFEMLKALELDHDCHCALLSSCASNRIAFFSTPFDTASVDLLCSLGVGALKVPSGELTNLPFLRHIGGTQKQLFVSTGMATLGEVEAAIGVLEDAGCPLGKITLLHCNTDYPSPAENANLRAINTLQHAFPGMQVGYSDHTLGIEIPIAAVAMGAMVIEKHFTLDRSLPGPDHRASLNPTELRQMVEGIRKIESALGNGWKRPTASEDKNIAVVRKSIVAARTIRKGEILSEDNLATKRPGIGISPMLWDKLVGRIADRDYGEDELICW